MVCTSKSGELENTGRHQRGLPECELHGEQPVIFNVKGNDYRLVVSVRYDRGLMYVRFIGTIASTTRLMWKRSEGADMELKPIRTKKGLSGGARGS